MKISPMPLLERVRSALLGAHLKGTFWLRREADGAVLLTLQDRTAGRRILAALSGAGFSVARGEPGSLIVR